MKSAKQKVINDGFTYFILILMSLFVLFPIMWMISTSLKTEQEALLIPPSWVPHVVSAFGFSYMWKMKPFLLYFINSLLTAGPAAFLSVIIGGLSAYSISRFRFRYRKIFTISVLFTQMIPGVLIVGPYFKILNKLSLYDTRLGLALGYIAVALPFCTWMLKGYFDSIPKELDEAALVDGCNHITALFKIILPLSLPGLVATFVFSFLLAWGDLLWALSLTYSESVTTITLGIANSVGEYRVVWPALMAAALIASIPSVLLYTVLQKYIVGGMTGGSVKG